MLHSTAVRSLGRRSRPRRAAAVAATTTRSITQQHVVADQGNDNGVSTRFFSTRDGVASQSSRSTSRNSIVPGRDDTTAIDHSNKEIDFQTAVAIEGEESHVAMVTLQHGERLRAEAGSMLFLTDGVVMDTKLNGASSAFSRMLTGQNMFLTDFYYEGKAGTSGTVCLGTDFPSKILKFSLTDLRDNALICQKGAYVASNPSVDIAPEFTKNMTSGFFGGQGFILQKLSGRGDVLVKGGGTIVNKELQEGETLRVTSGSIVAFESSVDYDVQMMPGVKNAMFGGEGLFVTTLTGPGRVWLQGLPPDRMIAEIARRVPAGGGFGLGVPIPMVGGGGASETAGLEDSPGVDTAGPIESTTDDTDTIEESDTGPDLSSESIDSDSPSALFGDAYPNQVASDDVPEADFQFGQTSDPPQNEFTQDLYTDFSTNDFADEKSFSDEEFFDAGSSASAGGESSNEVSESNIFQSLWDFFSDDD